MSNDEFWYQPKRPRREVVAEQMSRLTFVSTDEAPPMPAIVDMTEEELAEFNRRRDILFGHDYVQVVGAQQPMSKALARQLRYDVDRLPQAFSYEAGDDVEARPD